MANNNQERVFKSYNEFLVEFFPNQLRKTADEHANPVEEGSTLAEASLQIIGKALKA